MPATITKGNFQSDLEPIAKASFILGLGRELKERIEMYFSKNSSDKNQETYFEIGDIGPVPEFTGELDYEGLRQGYESVIVNKMFAKGMKIDYYYARVSQGIAKKLPKMLGLAMRRRINANSTSWFNNMFSSYLSRDGLSLVNAAHTSNVGGANQSNRITTAFGAVALTSAKITHRKLLTNRDNVMEIMPSLLFGPIDLESAFTEVIKSQGQVGTANNTINVHKGSWTAIVDIHFTDTNNWGIGDKELMKEFQVWQEVDAPDFKQMDDFDGFTAKYRCHCINGQGSTGYEWFLGAEVD